MSQEMKLRSENRSFGGWTRYLQHRSTACQSPMNFAVFLPPAIERGPVPVVYWLSGLTCTDENFMAKAGAQRVAAELGLMLVAPDTSPRGLQLPGEDEAWDFGTGAGFYVDATEAPWAANYRMFTYVSQELPDLIEARFSVKSGCRSIFGHSMGGHGALVTALRCPQRFRSVSAFAPISAPTTCPWGEKAFLGYLGKDRTLWSAYDAHLLLAEQGPTIPILVDQGGCDSFLADQLKPELLAAAAEKSGANLTLRMQPGYDHSYYFIASFIEDHLRFHAQYLD